MQLLLSKYSCSVSYAYVCMCVSPFEIKQFFNQTKWARSNAETKNAWNEILEGINKVDTVWNVSETQKVIH